MSGAVCLLLGAAGMVNGASLSKADRDFMNMAAKTDMTQAHIGHMAEDQASRTDVKDFAKTLTQESTESYRSLAELAAKDGVSIPNGIDTARDRNIRQLNHLKGARFDREFARDEIAANRRELALFQREAAHGQDPDVKGLAGSMVPQLEKQLHAAEECARKHGRS